MSNEAKNLTILLLTYKRTEYAITTIMSLLHNIEWDGEIRLHVADDGSQEGHVEAIIEAVRKDYPWMVISTSNSERGGYGKNYNLAMQQVHAWADFVIPIEDDWECQRRFDANFLARVLQSPEDGEGSLTYNGCIRLGYLGYTQRLHCWFEQYEGQHFLKLDQFSAEPHVFAGHPRFESVAWERHVGPWPEGLLPGETEVEVCHRARARDGILWPIELIKPSGDLFVHIGAVRSTDV